MTASQIKRLPWRHCVPALALLAAGGCASVNDAAIPDQQSSANDPLEPVNRIMFTLNEAGDAIIVRPAAVAYREMVPKVVRDVIHNILVNLAEPVTMVNQILQGDINAAGYTLGRFMTNSTLGMGGAIAIINEEYANNNDNPDDDIHYEDFGQTLAVWGVPEGPYLVLPLLGPSNPRDLAGRAVDYFFNPLNIVGLTTDSNTLENLAVAQSLIDPVDTRTNLLDPLDELRAESLDFYVTMRSVYRQRRDSEIRNGAAAPMTEE